ncbi:MAG TPA: protein kinase [Gemmatimonadales bacterium]|nr:protein kinase [Gemmatimonadales bacterium]
MSSVNSPDPIEVLRIGLADRYRIEAELGAGGMAVVYLARDLARDRNVALKVLRPELGVASGADRFDREIRLASRLVHPNILPLLDSGTTDGRLWYTMPYVEGETLRARLVRERQLPLDEVVRLTGEIAGGLEHAHGRGILHRDIKPENILLASGHALVADFGVARALADTNERITATGFAVGTPGYMSPEQSSGDGAVDARSDQYALASVSYEMLAGEPPFTGPTAQAIIARRLSQPAPSIRTIRPAIPEAVDAALRRALSPVPADRFDSTSVFARTLAGASSGGLAATPRGRARWGLFAAVAAAIAVIAFLQLRPDLPPGAGEPADRTVRLAVLPFRLLSSDTGDRYLAEGITEEVTSSLANLGGLRVIDRSSVAPVASAAKTPQEIGQSLGVDALVDGDVQKSGNAIRVGAKLIDPSTGETRWSKRWDHTSGDVFKVQSEVAAQVAGVLRIQLAERESRKLARPPTTNPEAYDAYLRVRALDRVQGRLSNRPRLDSMIVNLRQAVALDSTFATAWAELAARLSETVFLYDADQANLDEADRAIRTSLALDSTVAMAWKARHDLSWNAARGWHFAAALSEVRHAIELQPSLVAAHSALGSLYFHYGFLDEARRELQTSLSLDPNDGCDDVTRCVGFSRPRVARVLWYGQKFDSSVAVYQNIPYVGGFVWEYAVALNGAGRSADALALLDSAPRTGDHAWNDREASRALIYATMGRERDALDALARTSATRTSRSHFHHAQFTIACTYARLGRKRDAVAWLRQAADNGLPNYPLFRNDPNLASLQGDPDYESFMTRLQGQYEEFQRLVGK